MTPEQEAALEERLKRLEQKLLALEASNDPKSKETIAELRAQLEAITKKLDKAKDEKPADKPADKPGDQKPADKPADKPAGDAAPGGKKKSWLERFCEDD